MAELKKRKRPSLQVHTAEGEASKYILHAMEVDALGEVDMTNGAEVEKHVIAYFNLCAKNDMRPSVAGLALAFGVDRTTLWDWVNGHTQYVGEESQLVLRRAYSILNAQMEDYMQNGKINPVSGIFLLKNNWGYRDEKEVTVKPSNGFGTETSPEELQKKYIDSIDADALPPADDTE